MHNPSITPRARAIDKTSGFSVEGGLKPAHKMDIILHLKHSVKHMYNAVKCYVYIHAEPSQVFLIVCVTMQLTSSR